MTSKERTIDIWLPLYKTEGVNRTKTMRFYPFVFTSNAPRKGKRIPLNKIKYIEQRDSAQILNLLRKHQREYVSNKPIYWRGILCFTSVYHTLLSYYFLKSQCSLWQTMTFPNTAQSG